VTSEAGSAAKRRVIVYHTGYGCGTGCCGHVVEVDDKQIGSFEFGHPWAGKDDFREWAEELVRDACREAGISDVEGHVADLDWENCIVTED
jgi:hypothetical protein